MTDTWSRPRHASLHPHDDDVRIKFARPTTQADRSRIPPDPATGREAKSSQTDSESSALRRFPSIGHNADFQEALRAPGREPGINLDALDSRLEGVLYHECEITVTDYCEEKFSINGPFTNEAFLLFLSQPKPSWSKIRWISMNGTSLDILKALSARFELHRLAIEDVVHRKTRTKIDHYAKHSYICLPLLLLVEEGNLDDKEDLSKRSGMGNYNMQHREGSAAPKYHDSGESQYGYYTSRSRDLAPDVPLTSSHSTPTVPFSQIQK